MPDRSLFDTVLEYLRYLDTVAGTGPDAGPRRDAMRSGIMDAAGNLVQSEDEWLRRGRTAPFSSRMPEDDKLTAGYSEYRNTLSPDEQEYLKASNPPPWEHDRLVGLGIDVPLREARAKLEAAKKNTPGYARRGPGK